MLQPQQARSALRRLFQKLRIVELNALLQVLNTRSHMSVYRRLKELDYLSSYTHAGRYYTLPEIAQFDSLGLWRHGDVGFSRVKTLKATVAHLVVSSSAGRTQRELQELLGVRAHNPLLDLLRANKIRREGLPTQGSVYLSADSARGSQQLARRLEAATSAAALSGAMVLEVLIELVRMAAVEATPREVAQRLAARGHPVTAEHVREVFARYKLGEKRGVRSPRSRR